jgi:hypothetical protein
MLLRRRGRMPFSTRAFIANVDAQKGIIKDIEPYSSKWLTLAEDGRIVTASNAMVEKMIRERH